MINLPAVPSHGAVVRVLRWLLQNALRPEDVFSLTVAHPADEDALALSNAPFAWVMGSGYMNTGSGWVKIYPQSGGELTIVQLPTEGGATIDAVFHPNDGSPLGNYYTAGEHAQVVYYLPNTGLHYVWNPEGETLYSINLPGPVDLIPSVYWPHINGFVLLDSQGGSADSAVEWDAGNGWYIDPRSAQAWRQLDFEPPASGSLSEPANLRLALVPTEPSGVLDSAYALGATATFADGGTKATLIVRCEEITLQDSDGSMISRKNVWAKVVVYNESGSQSSTATYRYVWGEIKYSNGFVWHPGGWGIEKGGGGYAEIDSPDLSMFDNVTQVNLHNSPPEGYFSGCIMIA